MQTPERYRRPRALRYMTGRPWVISILVGSTTAIAMVPLSRWMNRVVLRTADVPISVGPGVMFLAAFIGTLRGKLGSCEAFSLIAPGTFSRGSTIALLVTAGAAVVRVKDAL